MASFITNTWGRTVLGGQLLYIGDQYGVVGKAYIQGMLDALEVAYMINVRHENYVDIRVDCSDVMFKKILDKINKYYSKG